ncbi:MAG: hypothetical protein GOVbin568_18 [Prokaryotic dsDNA virus sp.]|nr:MAG: hypothetical protein GOVbin568_18 [Prokaryotic dsDNA virus sp.]|tara:strand:+ start:14562 stop:15047 length:486 start_codon:yes stop_codon:yes gene_type:complete
MSIKYQGHNIKNLPFSTVTRSITSIMSSAKGVNTFTQGDIFEVDLKEITYPLAHLSYSSANFDTGTLTYSFQLLVMDLVSKNERNEDQVLSDTLNTIGDIISTLRNSNAVSTIEDYRNSFRLQDSISCEPFTERFDNEVTGWSANFTIEVEFDASACDGYV